MIRTDAADAGEGKERLDLLRWIAFGKGFRLPRVDRLVFDRGARGPAEMTIGAGEMRPGCLERFRIGLAVEGLKFVAELRRVGEGFVRIDGGRVFLAGVGDTIETRLDAASADREIHRAILRMDEGVGHGKGGAGDEILLHPGVARALGFEIHGIDFAPTPVEDVKGVLVFGREFRSVAEGRAGRRTGADVDGRGQIVRVELGIFSGAVAPAEFTAADDVVHAGGAIPGSVEIVFHVRVVGEELAGVIDRSVVDVAEARGDAGEMFSVPRDTVDDAAGGENVAVVAASIGHAGKKVIFAPDRRDGRGGISLGRDRVIAADEVEIVAAGHRHDGVNAVIAL